MSIEYKRLSQTQVHPVKPTRIPSVKKDKDITLSHIPSTNTRRNSIGSQSRARQNAMKRSTIATAAGKHLAKLNHTAKNNQLRLTDNERTLSSIEEGKVEIIGYYNTQTHQIASSTEPSQEFHPNNVNLQYSGNGPADIKSVVNRRASMGGPLAVWKTPNLPQSGNKTERSLGTIIPSLHMNSEELTQNGTNETYVPNVIQRNQYAESPSYINSYDKNGTTMIPSIVQSKLYSTHHPYTNEFTFNHDHHYTPTELKNGHQTIQSTGTTIYPQGITDDISVPSTYSSSVLNDDYCTKENYVNNVSSYQPNVTIPSYRHSQNISTARHHNSNIRETPFDSMDLIPPQLQTFFHNDESAEEHLYHNDCRNEHPVDQDGYTQIGQSLQSNNIIQSDHNIHQDTHCVDLWDAVEHRVSFDHSSKPQKSISQEKDFDYSQQDFIKSSRVQSMKCPSQSASTTTETLISEMGRNPSNHHKIKVYNDVDDEQSVTEWWNSSNDIYVQQPINVNLIPRDPHTGLEACHESLRIILISLEDLPRFYFDLDKYNFYLQFIHFPTRQNPIEPITTDPIGPFISTASPNGLTVRCNTQNSVVEIPAIKDTELRVAVLQEHGNRCELVGRARIPISQSFNDTNKKEVMMLLNGGQIPIEGTGCIRGSLNLTIFGKIHSAFIKNQPQTSRQSDRLLHHSTFYPTHSSPQRDRHITRDNPQPLLWSFLDGLFSDPNVPNNEQSSRRTRNRRTVRQRSGNYIQLLGRRPLSVFCMDIPDQLCG